ncbi:hypothetical protein AHAS_Ahas11G0003500 [Arachis hypogaea]
MAAAAVGEALLSAAVEAMIGKITTEISEFYGSKNLDESQLDKLESTMRILQAFLSDAEEKQIKNAAVKAWLDDLTQALFDADDLLDDVATEALRRKVEARYVPRRSLAVKVRAQITHFYQYVAWTNLMPIFNVGQMGSKIIVTTRHENVVDVVRPTKTCLLKPLADEDCWTLLSKHALPAHRCTELSSNLEDIGRKIAKKCGGLPLAAVALGGVLGKELSSHAWSKVLNSNIWNLTVKDVQPALLLSYHFLPASLKQCFAYCAIFPKNSKLRKEALVQLWMAQGFVNVSQNEKSIEEVGGEYFDELVARSLIRRSVDGQHFEMHDLINDLATMVSSPYCKRCEDQKAVENLNKIRHLSYDKNMFNHFDELDSLHGLKGLRTLLALPLPFDSYRSHYLANGVLHELLLALKQLRVLSLSSYWNITVLPNSIGDLKHLRHLDLSFTGIKMLPPAICKLYNLQTLLLSYCRGLTELPEEMGKLVNLRRLAIDNCMNLKELPKGMGKLVNLRRLDIDGTNLQEMPLEIAKLENLQSLSRFIVSKQQNGLKLAELRKFPLLQGELCISKLENVIDPSDACQANLKEKKQIKELLLKWSHSTLEDSHQVVLEHLQPSTNLKKLTVKCYGGTSFPNWLGDSSFGNIVSLWIEDCRHCSSLPPLGRLQSLKELFISGMKSVKSIGSEFYGGNSPSFQPFPSLETLSFESMAEWEEWNMIDGITTEFPRLSHLSLRSCPKLKGNLPSNLPCLVRLDVEDCCVLESEFSGEVDNRNIMRPLNLFNFNSLQQLSLFNIPSLTAFPSNGLPKALKTLSIEYCEKLEFPTHEFLQSCKALEDLKIVSSCCSLTSFPLGSLPVLKRLLLMICKDLKSISISEEAAAIQSLMFLEHLQVYECPELESISLLDSSTPNLSSFAVVGCDKMNSLPEPIKKLTGLQTLWIGDVPNLESIAEEGLPINLRTLGVGNEEGVYSNTAITNWGLDRLTSLSELSIKGDYLVKKLMEIQVPLLPNSLRMLEIEGAREIQHLDGKWLQHLTSLKTLSLYECDKLKSLPKERLPSSISRLEIRGCPMLKASCERKKGKEWPKIAHIPLIIFDW